MQYNDCKECEYLIPGYMGRRCLKEIPAQYIDEIATCHNWVKEEQEFITNEEIEN